LISTFGSCRSTRYSDLDEKENWPELVALTSIFSVELPVNRTHPKSSLELGKCSIELPETTRKYAK